MLDYAREAVALIQGKSRAELGDDRVLTLALTRLLEIVGEAAGRVSRDTQAEHPQVPWAEMVGLRNRVIHGYDAVDLDILWEVVHTDLPKLIPDLQRIVSSQGGGSGPSG